MEWSGTEGLLWGECVNVPSGSGTPLHPWRKQSFAGPSQAGLDRMVGLDGRAVAWGLVPRMSACGRSRHSEFKRERQPSALTGPMGFAGEWLLMSGCGFS